MPFLTLQILSYWHVFLYSKYIFKKVSLWDLGVTAWIEICTMSEKHFMWSFISIIVYLISRNIVWTEGGQLLVVF